MKKISLFGVLSEEADSFSYKAVFIAKNEQIFTVYS